MHNAQGYAVWTGPLGAASKEADTFTCAHCNSVVIVEAKTDPSSLGGFCRLCMKNICAACTNLGKCEPFEKKLEKLESRDRLLKSIGI